MGAPFLSLEAGFPPNTLENLILPFVDGQKCSHRANSMVSVVLNRRVSNNEQDVEIEGLTDASKVLFDLV